MEEYSISRHAIVNLLIDVPTVGHLVCFQILAIMNQVTQILPVGGKQLKNQNAKISRNKCVYLFCSKPSVYACFHVNLEFS